MIKHLEYKVNDIIFEWENVLHFSLMYAVSLHNNLFMYLLLFVIGYNINIIVST